jgi:uncharacterized protein (TIGR03118 family)
MNTTYFRAHDSVISVGRKINRVVFCTPAVVAIVVAALGFAAPANATYIQTNLVSDGSVSGTTVDPNLINPWGMAASTTSPFWVADNGSGLATLYDGSGSVVPLVVKIPPYPGGTGPGTPTGQVFNAGLDFHGNRFIFAAEDGTIAGWRNALGTTAERLADNSPSGAVYKGLAIGSYLSANYLYAANFHSGQIDVFDGNLSQTILGGNFTDPNLPSGYAPFNIQNIGGNLIVTYALQDASGMDDVAGAGNGFVDVFDTNGTFIRRLVSGGALNSPWGLALAPGDFAEFSSALLVGNSGDGHINAFDMTTGIFLGVLDDVANIPIVIDGLRALDFGNGGSGGLTNELFFTAGPNDEANGLFGKLTPGAVPEPATLGLMGIGAAAFKLSRSRRSGRGRVI